MGGEPTFPWVFHGGRWTTRDEAVFGAGSMALRYAVSVFDAVRLYAQPDGGVAPFALDEHVARLGRSARGVRLDDPGVGELPGVVAELVERNAIDIDAYVRMAVTAASPGDLGSESVAILTVTAAPMGRKRWLADDVGMSLAAGPWQRAAAAAFPPDVKCVANYSGGRLALLAARDAGYDGCLLLTADGYVSEAPTAAVFAVVGDELRTPPLCDGVLPSITRAWVISIAESLGLGAVERRLTPAELRTADEAFLCGTGIEFAPVRAVDGTVLGCWPDRPVTRLVVDAYFAAVRSLRAASLA